MIKSGAGMALAFALCSQTALAKEDLRVSYDEANKVFTTIVEPANVLGLIDYCDLKETYPEATNFLRSGLAPLIARDIPEEDRVTRLSLLIASVNSYAGGVAQGLTIAQVMNPQFNKEGFCKEADKLAKSLFPNREAGAP